MKLPIQYFRNIIKIHIIYSFNGWSDQIVNMNVDYIEQEMNLWCAGVTAIVRVILNLTVKKLDLKLHDEENKKNAEIYEQITEKG